MVKSHKFAIAFIGWLAFITWSSLFSFSGDDLPSFNIPHLDKLVHFTFYFIAVLLGVMFIRELTKGGLRLKKALLISLFGMIVFGIIIEVFQYAFTSSRMGDINDALANTLGALCGTCIMKFLFSGKRGLNWK